jgi:hypothetical protein
VFTIGKKKSCCCFRAFTTVDFILFVIVLFRKAIDLVVIFMVPNIQHRERLARPTHIWKKKSPLHDNNNNNNNNNHIMIIHLNLHDRHVYIVMRMMLSCVISKVCRPKIDHFFYHFKLFVHQWNTMINQHRYMLKHEQQ